MADTFVPASRASEPDRVYPLICDLCAECGHIQLRTVTDPNERYVDIEYSYTSSNSATSRAHWEGYASHVSSRLGTPAGAPVVEIGSNDGFLSAQFVALGHPTLGIDPSPFMAELAAKRGVRTKVGLFGSAEAQRVLSELGERPRLIVANNVFNHANEPADFVAGVRTLLHPDGVFVFELPYWYHSIEQKKFDQVYHEHVSYFTVAYADRLFRANDMHVADVEEVNYHGGSIRVYVRHGGRSDVAEAARPFVQRETEAGLFDVETYRRFSTDIVRARNAFLEQVYRLKLAGERIVCVGAAAKGNTFLNFYNLDATVIDYVTDSSAVKQGKFTPRTRIPIAADEVLAQYGTVHAIITSWNISDALRVTLSKVNPAIRFLNPYEGIS